MSAACLVGLGEVVAAQQKLAWAAQLWGAAEALRDAPGMPIPPVEGADYERSLSAARVHLGERAFAAAWSQGRAMTPQQALEARGQKPISRSTATAPSPTYPDGLTAREVEVLRLVAGGLTDLQIAEKLVLSPSTVHAHISSIYNKLGVTSRSAATRYAIEHHLARQGRPHNPRSRPLSLRHVQLRPHYQRLVTSSLQLLYEEPHVHNS